MSVGPGIRLQQMSSRVAPLSTAVAVHFSCCRGIEPKKLVNAIGYDGTLVYLGGGTDELKGVLAFDLILAQRS